MGLRVEDTLESTIRKSEKNDRMDILKKPTSPRPRVVEQSSYGEDVHDNDIMELVMLMELSDSSEAMKGLLLKILESDRAEKLKPFLKQKRSKKKSGRRSSGLSNSSHHKGTGTFTKLNSLPNSPTPSLRRSRQSEGCLRLSQRDMMQSPNKMQSPSQKTSRLVSSSSLLQLRNSRRADVGRRRPMVANTNPDNMKVEKQNASWDPVPGGRGMGKRGFSMGSFMRPSTFSPESSGKNATWGAVVSPTRGVEGMDKMQRRMLKKTMSENKLGLSPKKRNGSDHSNGEKKASKTGSSSKKKSSSQHSKSIENNGFAQFCPTGQVAFQENKVAMNELVDDLNSYRNSIRRFDELNVSANSGPIGLNDETIAEKKGLRNYLKRQLTKKGLDGSDSSNDKYSSLRDDISLAQQATCE